MKEDPGSSTLTMLVVHAYHPYPMPLFSEAGDKETSSAGLPPHQSNLGKAPSRPLQVHTPPLAKMPVETRLGGNHTSASDSRSEAIDWAKGGCGDHFGLFRASVRGQVAELYSAIRNQAGPDDQETTMAGRYGAEVYIRGTVVPLHHSAYTLGGDHTSRHIEKKHHQRDQRKNRLLG